MARLNIHVAQGCMREYRQPTVEEVRHALRQRMPKRQRRKLLNILCRLVRRTSH